MVKKDFITGAEFSLETLQKIIDLAIVYKNAAKNRRTLPDYSGKILTLIFANPSLRTHLSFEAGMKKMKGEVNVLHTGNSWQFEYADGVVMDSNKQEHIKEAARVISRYTDLIGLRNSELITMAASHNSNGAGNAAALSWEKLKKDEPINQLARYAEKPVINMESNMFHPCQGMADVMTMVEQFAGATGESAGALAKKKYLLTWAPHPKALPLATPHSQLLMPALFGADVTLAAPEGFELDADVVKLAGEKAAAAGGSLAISHDQKKAFEGADVVVAKSWASLKYFGDWAAESDYRKKFSDWTVTEEKMKLTNNAFFMHCLPVRRNVVVSDAVLDSPRSLIIDEAENRMWAQMAIISYLLS